MRILLVAREDGLSSSCLEVHQYSQLVRPLKHSKAEMCKMTCLERASTTKLKLNSHLPAVFTHLTHSVVWTCSQFDPLDTMTRDINKVSSSTVLKPTERSRKHVAGF